jgi:hypothetical protein
MEAVKIRKALHFLRDYGIVLLTGLLLIISIQLCHHQNNVTYNIEPAVRQNGISIDSNQQMMKDLTKQLDSLRVEIKHTEKEHVKILKKR